MTSYRTYLAERGIEPGPWVKRPASAIEARSDETAKTGSARRVKARSAKPRRQALLPHQTQLPYSEGGPAMDVEPLPFLTKDKPHD